VSAAAGGYGNSDVVAAVGDVGGSSAVEAALLEAIEVIRPALQADGGDMRVLELREDEGVVDIELLGACGGCPMSNVTLKAGIERILKDRVPGLVEVRAKGIDFDVEPV
jgi:Fe-S cluster biogenesis protein NfuA